MRHGDHRIPVSGGDVGNSLVQWSLEPGVPPARPIEKHRPDGWRCSSGVGLCARRGMEVRVMRRIQRLAAIRRAALAAMAAGAVMALAACGSQLAGRDSASGSQPRSGSQSPSAAGSASTGSSSSAAGKGAPAVGFGASAPAALCSAVPHLTSVVVSRTSGFRDFQQGPALARGIVIVEVGRVRGLAAALCGLPVMPGIAMTCPAQFGVGSLRFAFAAGASPFPPAVVQMSGCRLVTGLGPTRRASSPAFWRTIDHYLGGLASPSPGTSGGIMP